MVSAVCGIIHNVVCRWVCNTLTAFAKTHCPSVHMYTTHINLCFIPFLQSSPVYYYIFIKALCMKLLLSRTIFVLFVLYCEMGAIYLFSALWCWISQQYTRLYMWQHIYKYMASNEQRTKRTRLKNWCTNSQTHSKWWNRTNRNKQQLKNDEEKSRTTYTYTQKYKNTRAIKK